jgi:hypothetical protein
MDAAEDRMNNGRPTLRDVLSRLAQNVTYKLQWSRD